MTLYLEVGVSCPRGDVSALDAMASSKVGGGVEFSGKRSGRPPLVPVKHNMVRMMTIVGFVMFHIPTKKLTSLRKIKFIINGAFINV